MLRSFRKPIETSLARLALAVIPRLSRPAVRRLSGALGALACLLMRRERRTALANLALIFPDMAAAEQRRILRDAMNTFALAMLDTFWLARLTRERLETLVDFHPTFVDAVLKPGRQICLTAHIGNWEVLGIAVTHRGFPLESVTAPLKNPAVDVLFNQLRAVTGMRTVARRGAVRSLLRTLRSEGKIALVLDQNVRPAQGGVFVDFFGRPAPFSAAAAQLALRTQAPMVIGACLPYPTGGYFTPPIKHIDQSNLPAQEDEAVLELTRRIARGLEELIREYPGNWLWTYKRWKFIPNDADPARYPFYARQLRERERRALKN